MHPCEAGFTGVICRKMSNPMKNTFSSPTMKMDARLTSPYISMRRTTLHFQRSPNGRPKGPLFAPILWYAGIMGLQSFALLLKMEHRGRTTRQNAAIRPF